MKINATEKERERSLKEWKTEKEPTVLSRNLSQEADKRPRWDAGFGAGIFTVNGYKVSFRKIKMF